MTLGLEASAGLPRGRTTPEYIGRMPDFDNPAGRLHYLLNRFSSDRDEAIITAWARALEVEQSEVHYQLGRVAALLDDVRTAAKETGSPAFEGMPRHLDALAGSIFPIDEAFGAPVANVAPDQNAMEMLAALSYALKISAPEGTIPSEEDLSVLKASASDLVDEIQSADLPAEIRRALLHRLAEMLEALEHLEVGGPDAVRRAAEALAATAAIYAEDAQSPEMLRKVADVARHTWAVFKVATLLAGAAITWPKIVDFTGDLGQGQGQEQRQLPPGEPSHDEDKLEPPAEKPSP